MGDVNVLIDLHDSEIIRLEKVLEVLNQRQGQSGISLEAFRKEAIERMAQQGFKVDVKVFTTSQEGLYAFDIEIVDRLSGEFDPDRQVHEATADILDLGTRGVIKGGL